MKKLAVVLGVAAVATFTGCKDPDYAGKKIAPPEEAKSIETEPLTPPAEQPKVEEVKVDETQVVVAEKKCECLPGTKHTEPCKCGAADCKCIVEKPVEPETTVYIVQNGDYLSKISKKYNVTISSIMRLNNLKSDKIRIGQKLKLPGKIDVGEQKMPANAKASPAKHGAMKAYAPYSGATKEYVVKNGDTLGGIAYGNGITIRQLKELNNLSSDALKIGQKLKIPAEKVTKAAPAKSEPAKAKPVETAKSAETVKPVEEVKPVETAKPVEEVKPEAAAPEPEAAAPTESSPVVEEAKPAAPATTTYVVQEGEDLTRIAVDFGVTPTVIRELNNLAEGDQVKPGQVLKIPAESQE